MRQFWPVLTSLYVNEYRTYSAANVKNLNCADKFHRAAELLILCMRSCLVSLYACKTLRGPIKLTSEFCQAVLAMPNFQPDHYQKVRISQFLRKFLEPGRRALVRARARRLFVSVSARCGCPIFRFSELGPEQALTRPFSNPANQVNF